MKPVRARPPRRAGRATCAAALIAATATACAANAPSVLDPRGPAARHVTALWWPMLWVSAAVFAFVVAMAAWGIVRGRRRSEGDLERTVAWGERFVLIAGLGVSSAILIAFFIVSVRSMASLQREGNAATLQIAVTGHDWWWEARYPNGAVTANEIHIPTGEPVRLLLSSADVIHSLWVPQLVPKIDLIPGRDNQMWIQADAPGRYRGQCAEYCGLQHAHMIFFVVADRPDAFRQWMASTAAPAVEPADALTRRGREIFLSNTCIGCHTIRGTAANGMLGPDLTHLATRETIGAGTIPLSTADLARFILDPASEKPGVSMPPASLTPEEIRALVAYLMSLGFGSAS